MKYAQLGNTGVFVSRLCLGTMTFGGKTPPWNIMGGLDQQQTSHLVGRSLDAGINFIDTANVYGAGNTEAVLGEAIKGKRDQVVLASKLNARMGPGPNDIGQSRLALVRELDNSLRRLQTDHIDLYQLHNFDRYTPLEETLRALDDAVRSGKVRYIGCSNYAAWQVMKALGISREHNLARFASVQSYYSLAGRDLETDLGPMIADQGLCLMVWSPLAGGYLSGKFGRDGSSDKGARRSKIAFPPVDESRLWNIVDVQRAVAARHGATPAQVALAWVLAQKPVGSVIIGVKTEAQLDDNLGSIDLVLTEQDLAELNAVSRFPARYPGWIQTYYANARVPKGYPFDGPSWGHGDEPK